MTVVLVHGVPETARVWDRLVAALGRDDVVRPGLPGFGTPRPDGFAATKEAYVDWLVRELEATDGPVDLVGHDWGGGLVVRLVSIRPDLVRSWVTDAAGIGDVAFEWHDFAKIWQTPGEGEAFFQQQLTDRDTEGAVFAMFGVPPEPAREMASWLDPTMADCILALYRSAVDVGKEWAPDFEDIPKPGLVLVPTDDPFLGETGGATGAHRSGASMARLEGVGHWWMLQDPERGAAVLRDFWSTLDA
ncbi:MAG: alpha/beta hydrolase [Actinobacteria bacterium]|nr:alpha/beta hydrolase [Actinomycetota bacterium]